MQSQNYSDSSQTKKIVFGLLFFVFSVLYYYIKLQSPALISAWYDAQKYEWLNQLSGISRPLSLGFYLGQIEERVFGPLSQLISGLLFAAFALLFLTKATRWKFGLAVFIYLILTKLEVLFFPPYGDAIGGPFSEAIWLKKNGFDYAGLFHQPGYAAGGPKVYVFSVYPTYLALLMTLLPNVKLFLIVNHLLVFAMAASIVALFRDVVARTFSRETAIFLAFILLYFPLFQSQTEAINMEMPCAFFVMLSAYALIERKVSQASMMAMASVLVKGIGVFSCAAVGVISAVMWLGKAPEFRRSRKILLWWLALAAMMTFSLSVKYILKDQHVSAGMVKLFVGWPSLKIFFISRLYLWALFIIIAGLIAQRLFKGKETPWRPVLPQKYDLLVMVTFCTLWFLLFLNFYAVSPRYRLAVYPFLVYTVFYAFAILVRSQILRTLGLVVTMAAALFYSYGRFEPPMIENDHVLLERTLEYRTDLKLNQLIAKTVEDKYDKYLVGAPFIMAQLLAIPELGYVHKPLDVMIYGFPCFYGGIKNFPGIENLNIGRTVYVGVQVNSMGEGFPYPVGPQDKVINQLEYGNKKISFFMGGVAIEMLYRRSAIIRMRQQQMMRNK